jgi:hypothetical protein
MTTFLNAALAPADADEQEEAMAHDALMYELSVVLMRLDGNDGDPHQLVWCGGPVPEPWGDAWQKYEEQAEAVINAIGEGSARALVELHRGSIPADVGRRAMEALARVIYNQWTLVPGWVPWQEGGNSFRQDEARDIARAAITELKQYLPAQEQGEKERI